MSEIENGRLGLYGAEYSKCNRMMTLGFKGLTNVGIKSESDEIRAEIRDSVSEGVVCGL